MAPDAEPVEILYILGPGHCGSTLLNLCLNRHSRVVGVSEIVTLNRDRPGWSGDEDVLATLFWAKVDQEMRSAGDGGLKNVPFSLSRVPASEMAPALRSNQAALQGVLRVAGKSIIADASKEPHRLGALLDSPRFRVRVIYLIRDGRAVVHAYRRKYGTWFSGWRKLMRIDRAARRLMAEHGNTSWLIVRYEDMATDLEYTLRRICDFAGIHFELAMLSPDTAQFNGLGGNRIRKRPVERITLDTAWTTEMPPMIRAFTALTVQRFNGRHGYRG